VGKSGLFSSNTPQNSPICNSVNVGVAVGKEEIGAAEGNAVDCDPGGSYSIVGDAVGFLVRVGEFVIRRDGFLVGNGVVGAFVVVGESVIIFVGGEVIVVVVVGNLLGIFVLVVVGNLLGCFTTVVGFTDGDDVLGWDEIPTTNGVGFLLGVLDIVVVGLDVLGLRVEGSHGWFKCGWFSCTRFCCGTMCGWW
jgi:hypothetical protein